LTRSGKTLFNSIVPEYISTFGELNGVVYKGPTASAKDVLTALLASKEFDGDIKTATFTDIGAACACNPQD